MASVPSIWSKLLHAMWRAERHGRARKGRRSGSEKGDAPRRVRPEVNTKKVHAQLPKQKMLINGFLITDSEFKIKVMNNCSEYHRYRPTVTQNKR